MGVLALDGEWQPSGAVNIDTGDISGATTGAKIATVAATLAAGNYAAVILADTSGISVRAGMLLCIRKSICCS